MAHKLPPSWWQAASADVEFLYNRFPTVSEDIAIPIDGDRALPLEMLSRGYASRRQLYRELSYYVPVGTPCLVHDDSIAGSSIQPKVRWAIAKGQYREQ